MEWEEKTNTGDESNHFSDHWNIQMKCDWPIRFKKSSEVCEVCVFSDICSPFKALCHPQGGETLGSTSFWLSSCKVSNLYPLITCANTRTHARNMSLSILLFCLCCLSKLNSSCSYTHHWVCMFFYFLCGHFYIKIHRFSLSSSKMTLDGEITKPVQCLFDPRRSTV